MVASNDKEWQEMVTKRDVYCVFHSSRLECLHSPISAHHIIRRSEKSTRLDTNNGVGLCVSCHAFVHSHPQIGKDMCKRIINKMGA